MRRCRPRTHPHRDRPARSRWDGCGRSTPTALVRACGSLTSPGGVLGPEAFLESVGARIPPSQKPAPAAIAVVPPFLLQPAHVAEEVEVVDKRAKRGCRFWTSFRSPAIGELGELTRSAI